MQYPILNASLDENCQNVTYKVCKLQINVVSRKCNVMSKAFQNVWAHYNNQNYGVVQENNWHVQILRSRFDLLLVLFSSLLDKSHFVIQTCFKDAY